MDVEKEELKQLIIHALDVTDLLDLLGLDIADVVEKFEDEIMENYSMVARAVL
jgi:hypothetical protein